MNKPSDLVNRILQEMEDDIVKKYSILLLSALNNKAIRGKTRLMKELFLISKNIPKLEAEADFEAYNYGPNSDYVSNALEELEVLNLIHKDGDKYYLTDAGKKIVNKLKPNIDKDEIDLIEDMKELFDGLTTDEMLAIVYFTYPEMTFESLVKQRIDRKREQLAINLLKKGKVSISKAAEMAGMPLDSFYDLLKHKGIKLKMG